MIHLTKTFPYNISGHFPCYCPFLKPLIHVLSFDVPMLFFLKNSSSVSVLSCQLDYKNRNSLRAGMVYYTVYKHSVNNERGGVLIREKNALMAAFCGQKGAEGNCAFMHSFILGTI